MLTTFEIKVLESTKDELEELVVDFEFDIFNLKMDIEEGEQGLESELKLLTNRLRIVREALEERMTVREKYDRLFA